MCETSCGTSETYPSHRDREIVGAPARDERPYEVHGLREELAVALVLAEGPLVEPLTAVAQGSFGTDVGRDYELAQGLANVEDHLGHRGLPASLFVNRVLVRGQRTQATKALTTIRTTS
jgi:hypothetical protein